MKKIDAIDKKISDLLIEDGRMSCSQIASRIGEISERAVRYRIDRLIKYKIISVHGNVNAENLGLSYLEYDKSFVIIGNQNAITYREILPLIRDNKVWLGINLGRGISGFIVPEHYELYGTETRIKIDKNQLNKPFDASAEGRMDCVSDGIIAPENLDAYKKTHLLNIVKAMNEANNSNFEASDVRFEEENTSSDE